MEEKVKNSEIIHPYFKKEKSLDDSKVRFYCSSLQDAFHILSCFEILDETEWSLYPFSFAGKPCFIVSLPLNS